VSTVGDELRETPVGQDGPNTPVLLKDEDVSTLDVFVADSEQVNALEGAEECAEEREDGGSPDEVLVLAKVAVVALHEDVPDVSSLNFPRSSRPAVFLHHAFQLDDAGDAGAREGLEQHDLLVRLDCVEGLVATGGNAGGVEGWKDLAREDLTSLTVDGLADVRCYEWVYMTEKYPP
jgi:hypothetical protein